MDAGEITQALGQNSAWARMRQEALARGEPAKMSPEEQAKLRQHLNNMSEEEKAVEMQLLLAEGRANHDLVMQARKYHEMAQDAQQQRRDQGNETLSDKVKRLGGWST